MGKRSIFFRNILSSISIKLKTKAVKHVLIFGFIAMALSCGRSTTKEADTNAGSGATMYYNGDIITMAGDSATYAEAIVVKDGKILFAGARDEAMKQAGMGHSMVDLEGKTMMPGFIDAHGHIYTTADYKRYAFLRGDNVKNIPQLIAELKRFASEMNIPKGEFILGNGFDATLLEEKRSPTVDELDQVSTDHPVYIVHASGHMGVANHKALELVGFNESSKDPEGGKIMRKEGSKQLSGMLEENAHFFLWDKVPGLDEKTGAQYMKLALEQSVAAGLTTVQDAGVKPNQLPVLVECAKKNVFNIDVVGLVADVFSDQLRTLYTSATNTPIQTVIPGPKMSSFTEEGIREGKAYLKEYNGNFRIAGLKMWMDGSPLAGTALLRDPYTAKYPGKSKDYKGFTNATDEDLFKFLDRWYPTEYIIQVHVNGDGTADQFLNVMDKVIKKHGKKDQKVVMIHCSLVQEDQIVRMKEMGIMPSFYSTTLSEAAESFQLQIGDRINRMQPAGLGAKHGLVYTIHNDAPLIPLEMVPLIWSAVNRKSKLSGKVFGPEYALTPYQALLAVTRYAAYQLGEDKSKGSIEAGKRADLVILDKNPLKVAKDDIRGINVMTTIKDGRKVFEKSKAVARVQQASMHADLADDPCERLYHGKKIAMLESKKIGNTRQ